MFVGKVGCGASLGEENTLDARQIQMRQLVMNLHVRNQKMLQHGCNLAGVAWPHHAVAPLHVSSATSARSALL